MLENHVRILPVRVNLKKEPWCREALVVYVNGSGALRWECRTHEDPNELDGLDHCLTLWGTPLISWEAPFCDTCESLLLTGWGRDTVPELERCREVLNGGFHRLEDAVPTLSPLLELLEPGLYVLAEGNAFPSDGGGRFFWDVPDGRTPSAATAPVYLFDDDYDAYGRVQPVFLYPSQKRSRFDPDRAAYYKERLTQAGPPPHGIALHVTEGISLLLDGHHKAAAAALLRKALPCITIFSLEYYQMQRVETPPPPPKFLGRLRRRSVIPKRMEREAAVFGPFVIPVEALPDKLLPEAPWVRKFQMEGLLPAGRLADRKWPEEYRITGTKYPTARECTLAGTEESGYPTDEDLKTWLAAVHEHRRSLRAALVLLRTEEDPRLKAVALRCAAEADLHSSLKKESFQVLAAMHGDEDAEHFFVDFFVGLDSPPDVHGSTLDHLTEIAHSFWN